MNSGQKAFRSTHPEPLPNIGSTPAEGLSEKLYQFELFQPGNPLLVVFSATSRACSIEKDGAAESGVIT